MLVVPLVLVLISSVVSQKRWYFTGSYKNENSRNLFFNGARMQHSDLYHLSNQLNELIDFWTPTSNHNESFLFAGGSFLRIKSVNSTVNDQLWNIIKLQVSAPDNESFALNSAIFYTQVISFNYGEAVQLASPEVSSDDFLMSAEVGLYDHAIDQFLERYWREIGTGEFVAVTATTNHTDENRSIIRKHRILLAIDVIGRTTMVSHTWESEVVPEPIIAAETITEDAKAAAPLRVMTYNLWHNNPPSWIYRDKTERWNRYEKRLAHFADIIAEEDPDVITLQEVRHDTGFLTPQRHINHWNMEGMTSEDGGNQVDHLLSQLAAARKRRLAVSNQTERSDSDSGAPYYQVVFQPAMAMIDKHRLMAHNEEGCLILSKLPIVSSDVHFLPRSVGDGSDDHQRIVLRAKVLVTDPVSHRTTTADIMTTHLSLSETARDFSTREIIKLSSCSSRSNVDQQPFEIAPIQVLTGDFNAEPHENFIRQLLHERSYKHIDCSKAPRSRRLGGERGASFDPLVTTADVENAAPFVDSWLHYATLQYEQRLERQHESASQTVATAVDVAGNVATVEPAVVMEDGFTFPACNPIKRIDFIMVRNFSISDTVSTPVATIEQSRIVGTLPTADTMYLVNSREGLGMNDMDSPVWASDHFAVVTDLTVHF